MPNDGSQGRERSRRWEIEPMLGSSRGAPLGLRQLDRAGPARLPFRRGLLGLFLAGVILCIVPVLRIPGIGVTLSAVPLGLALAELMNETRERWLDVVQPWRGRMFAVVAGLLASLIAQLFTNPEIDLRMGNLADLIRWPFWALLFCASAYLSFRSRNLEKCAAALAFGGALMAFMRLAEGIVYSNFGLENTVLYTRNGYAFFFSIAAPIALATLIASRSVKQGMASGAATALIFGATLLNASRGGWISVTVGSISVLLLAGRGRQIGRGAVVFGLLAGGGAVVLGTATPELAELVSKRFDTFENLEVDKTTETRRWLDAKAWKLFRENPFFGIGTGQFPRTATSVPLSDVTVWVGEVHLNRLQSHNSYLSHMAENGLCGMIPLLFLIGSLGWRGFWAARELTKRGAVWVAGLYGGYIAMSLHMWAINSMTTSTVWIVYGLIAGAVLEHEGRPGSGRVVVSERSLPEHALVIRRSPALEASGGRSVVVSDNSPRRLHGSWRSKVSLLDRHCA